MFLKGKRTGFLEGVQTVSDCSVYIKAFTRKGAGESERTGKKGCYPYSSSFPPVLMMLLSKK